MCNYNQSDLSVADIEKKAATSVPLSDLKEVARQGLVRGWSDFLRALDVCFNGFKHILYCPKNKKNAPKTLNALCSFSVIESYSGR